MPSKVKSITNSFIDVFAISNENYYLISICFSNDRLDLVEYEQWRPRRPVLDLQTCRRSFGGRLPQKVSGLNRKSLQRVSSSHSHELPVRSSGKTILIEGNQKVLQMKILIRNKTCRQFIQEMIEPVRASKSFLPLCFLFQPVGNQLLATLTCQT